MVSHSSKCSDQSDLFWVTAASAFNLRTLQQTGYFQRGKQQTSPKIPTKLTSDEKLVARVLAQLLQAMRYNTHGVLELMRGNTTGQATTRNPLVRILALAVLFSLSVDVQVKLFQFPSVDPTFRRTTVVGSAIFPTLALLNHSCDHNIVKYNVGTKVVAISTRRIRQGEEIAENYFPHHAFMPKVRRISKVLGKAAC